MTRYHTYYNKVHTKWLMPTAALLATLLTQACERRELWVLADEYPQVELVTDWNKASERPDGMTAWFIDNDNILPPHNHKTAEVSHTWLSLPRGNYTGLVFDYSPEEYGRLTFVNMNDRSLAEVTLVPDVYQPSPGDNELYGLPAVPESMRENIADAPSLPSQDTTAPRLFLNSAEPEPIHLDVLNDVQIATGADDDYILWKGRNNYATNLVTYTLNAQPKPIVWRLHVVVNVKGIYYLRAVRATIAGLSDGYMMTQQRHADRPCLQTLSDWNITVTGTNTGYISSTIHTFGLPEMPFSRMGELDHQYLNDLRLNIECLLRDEQTVINYHFNVNPYVSIYDDLLVVRIDIPIDLGPDLPYVDAKGSTGFDATVTPWQDGGTADTTM